MITYLLYVLLGVVIIVLLVSATVGIVTLVSAMGFW